MADRSSAAACTKVHRLSSPARVRARLGDRGVQHGARELQAGDRVGALGGQRALEELAQLGPQRRLAVAGVVEALPALEQEPFEGGQDPRSILEPQACHAR